ncbi:hypothetical protein AHF37_09098 [Paragonimus kellicotti]|nr:hypothetical protein AHF37_09098 [Paragonimus kellicotti]
MEAQIIFNNSMLVANGINYTCPPFKELVKAALTSEFYYNRTSYLWRGVQILDEKSDGRTADRTTASRAAEQTSTSNDPVVTMRTTTRGGGVRIIGCLTSIILPGLIFSTLPAML